ncbi:hypothetical protein DFJ74DRAFT_714001 [Hyaloraphidium curvatum]|nr:hypothetical protein DFJ74DRAFT_714001 [Hyaloraphidium curvatum]
MKHLPDQNSMPAPASERPAEDGRRLPPELLGRVAKLGYCEPGLVSMGAAKDKDSWTCQDLVTFMLACRDCYYLGLPLLMRHLDLGSADENDDVVVSQDQWRACLGDCVGADKFALVRSVHFVSFEDDGSDCAAQLSVLRRCIPNVVDLKFSAYFTPEVAESFWSLFQDARSLEEVEITAFGPFHRPLEAGFRLPRHLRSFRIYFDETLLDDVVPFLDDLGRQAHLLDDFKLGGPLLPDMGLGTALIAKMTSASVYCDDLDWLSSFPGLAIRDLRIEEAEEVTEDAWSGPPLHSVRKVTMRLARAYAIQPVLAHFPSLTEITIYDAVPWSEGNAEDFEVIAAKIRQSKLVQLRALNCDRKKWEDSDRESEMWLSLPKIEWKWRGERWR